MKKSLVVMLMAIIMGSGCTSMDKTMHVNRHGRLGGEHVTILARPLEFGSKSVGDVVGEASYTKIFMFFTLEGDAVSDNTFIPVFGGFLNDPLEMLAATRAVDTKNADGIYLLRKEEEGFNILGIYKKRHVKIRGKAIVMGNLGMMTEERADELRIKAFGGKGDGSWE